VTEAFICDAIRTPIGRFAGALSGVRTDDLASLPIAELLARNPGLDPAAIDEVFLGCANQSGEDNRNVARMAALLAGLPVSVPGTTINRLCASGADAVGTARARHHCWGNQPRRCRGRREHDARALCDGKIRHTVFA
jgi:acetyl-CoA acetyltransferase